MQLSGEISLHRAIRIFGQRGKRILPQSHTTPGADHFLKSRESESGWWSSEEPSPAKSENLLKRRKHTFICFHAPGHR
jgi:hypothetical protein